MEGKESLLFKKLNRRQTTEGKKNVLMQTKAIHLVTLQGQMNGKKWDDIISKNSSNNFCKPLFQ